ncbi:hypothetical protein EJB05_00279, partial [Eragrostis curvula]
MASVMVSVATGVTDSVVGKLTTLLGDQYRLARDVKRGIRFMKDELSSMNALLLRLADMDDDQIDVQTQKWKSKVRELSYDIEDCVDRFIHLRSTGEAKVNFVHSMVHKIKELWEDRQIAKEIQELKARVLEAKERRNRYNLDLYISMTRPVLLDPRAPIMYEEARDLVGIDGPREEIIGWLKDEERKLKVVSIFGIGGQGKTTLAMEVYQKFDEQFDCRATVTVSRTLDMKKLLKDLLFQINKRKYRESEMWEIEQLIPTLRKQLMNKRYLVVIDDIWTTSAWEHVKSALPANEKQSRIITTTRIRDVAKSCCTGIDGHMYEAKPLSKDDSLTLLFRRIFGSNEDCPKALEKVAKGIVKKCGGLPLAIISIAGLLANRQLNVEAWTKILSFISYAMEKDSPIDKMKRILFLSYFDLPHYLKTCLLYLSIFPEDSSIRAKDLIWRWVAEGLIPGHNTESMELMGESYLNELINRSMVQPTKMQADEKTVEVLRVHDVVLEFIVSQAGNDNFVTVWNGKHSSGNYSTKFRRLSIQTNISEAEEMSKAVHHNVSHLRSVNIFISDLELSNHVPHLLDSQVLRVMLVPGCCIIQDCRLRHTGSFSQLKYLKITAGRELPELGILQNLETLDLQEMDIQNLPASIVQLQKLVHLLIPGTALPSGIGNLQALEVLSMVSVDDTSAEWVQELGDLTKLRELKVGWEIYSTTDDADHHVKVFLSSLSKLFVSLQKLRIWNFELESQSDFTRALTALQGSTLLQSLALPGSCFRTIPSGISSLVNLTSLKIGICGEVKKQGLNILASLPMLLCLRIHLYGPTGPTRPENLYPRHAIGRQGFQRLMKLQFYCDLATALEFEPGAMPSLKKLILRVQPRPRFLDIYGQIFVGLQNLSCLKHITVVPNYDDFASCLENEMLKRLAITINQDAFQVMLKVCIKSALNCMPRFPFGPHAAISSELAMTILASGVSELAKTVQVCMTPFKDEEIKHGEGRVGEANLS